VQEVLRKVKVLVIGDRADSYGSGGGNMAHEVKAALKDDPENRTLCINRIYGLGGLDFFLEDAEDWFRLALETARTGVVEKRFDYHGVTPGDPEKPMKPLLRPIAEEETRQGLVQVELDPDDGRLRVEMAPLHRFTTVPNRAAEPSPP
jgi:pyruvate ferredoxin oxidoreductase alpha subunit